jgi:hypothetical protein
LDLSHYAFEGYDEPSRPRGYMVGSDAYMAWRVGVWLRERHDKRPNAVTSAHGYRVNVDGERIIEVWEDSDPQDVTLRD